MLLCHIFILYPINMHQRNSTSRERYFHREIKRELLHPCLFWPSFLKAACQGMSTPRGSDKYSVRYPNSPTLPGYRATVSIFKSLAYTSLKASSVSHPLSLPRSMKNRSMTPYRLFNLLQDKFRTCFALHAGCTLLTINLMSAPFTDNMEELINSYSL